MHERGYLEAMPGQALLILVGTVLRPTIRTVNATFRWLPQGHGHIQCADGEVAFHPVADSPCCYPEGICVQITQGNDTPRIKIRDDCQIQPALTDPDIGYVASLLPTGEFTVRHFWF